MDKDNTVKLVNLLIEYEVIPPCGRFEITESMINSSVALYGQIIPRKNTGKISSSNKRFIRKMAAITLLKESLSRPGVLKPKCGILYLISNPVFPCLYKIGITQDLDKRLASYQTYDPYRRYKVEHYIFVPDMRIVEKNILNQFKTDLAKGEWINSDKVKQIFNKSL